MKIAIIGTRGIPNHYGGFEQFADILSQGLVQKGHDVTVYCSKNHLYKESIYNGVKLIHKFDPENKIGTVGQFIYDLVCINDARKHDFDIVYLLGYTSSSVWQRILKNKAIIVTNMDGLEWKRSKYSPKVQMFLKYAETLAVKHSDYLIADSIGIQSYLKEKYHVETTFLTYGSFVFEEANEKKISIYNVELYNYDILIARFEPENNIEMILQAFSASKTQRQLLLVGNHNNTEFGQRMSKTYCNDKRIRFMGAIYDQTALNNLRYYSNLYFHGHSVGGTNPSLLEAMGSSCLICYHNNEFNHAILGEDGIPFLEIDTLSEIINVQTKANYPNYIKNNLQKISTIYSWKTIIEQYEHSFVKMINNEVCK